MIIRLIILYLLAHSTLADQTDPRLDDLFGQLQASSDPESAHRIEGMIWAIWLDSNNTEINQWMEQGIAYMENRQYETAVAKFTQIIQQEPDFAEGWNKRATVYYLQDKLTASMHDVQRTLALEPRHFGALAGLGLIFTELGDYQAAIKAYSDVLRIHPLSTGANFNLQQLRRTLHSESI